VAVAWVTVVVKVEVEFVDVVVYVSCYGHLERLGKKGLKTLA
jgi:hypothetical protein